MSEQRGWPHEPVDTSVAPSPITEQPTAFSVQDPSAPPEPAAAPAGRPRALIALAVMAAVAVILGGFALVDWFSRNRELDVLLDRIERAERSQLLPRDSLDPLLRDCYFSADDCDTAAMARIAARSLPDLVATGDTVAKTRLTRHHRALRNLRDKYVEHNLAWRTWLTTLERGTTGDVEPPSAISTTFLEAGDAAQDAVPPFAFSNARSRIGNIFR